ncbi:NAD(P)H-binding protein [Pseudomonas sp. Pseusp122]|uniref:NmrA family NAD(P)-binding protein n=1 Tax=unclassified Pseudomonas TaxID=196821 RepID=UPI0039A52D09
MNKMSQPLLITGAGGRLGQAILAVASKTENTSVIATTRAPEAISANGISGLSVRAADFDHPDSLAAAFKGAKRLLLISTDELHQTGKRIRQHESAIQAAIEAGVEHIVYTSMPAPDRASAVPFAVDHSATEHALRRSGVGHTIMRVSWYTENLLDLGILSTAVSTGKWYTSAGAGTIPYVPRSDVARAAWAALASGDTATRTLDITGSIALSVEAMAAVAAEVFNKNIEVIHVDDVELAKCLARSGLAEPLIPMIVATDANTRAGNFQVTSDSIRELTGQAPSALKDFLLRYVSTFATTNS